MNEYEMYISELKAKLKKKSALLKKRNDEIRFLKAQLCGRDLIIDRLGKENYDLKTRIGRMMQQI